MAVQAPYTQLVGTVTFFLAPASTAEPAVNATPSATWTELGTTDGDQIIEKKGPLTKFYDNSHQGPVKSHRPEENVMVRATLVNLTLEDVARITNDLNLLVSAAGPPAIRQLPFKSGETPVEYALLMKGVSDSPYGDFPGQNYFPRVVFEGEFTRTRSKTDRDAIEFEATVLEDDNQPKGREMGWATVQIS